MSIHICIFIETTHQNKKLNLSVGGVANQLLQLLKSFEKLNDLKISIVTKYSEYIPLTKKVKIFQIHKFNFNLMDTIYFIIKSFFSIVKIHKKNQIDVISIEGHPVYVITAYLVRFFYKIPILMKMPLDFDSFLRQIYLLENKNIWAKIVNFSWFKFFKKVLLKKTDYIRPINKKMFDDLLKNKFPIHRILIIPNGIESKKFINIKKLQRENTHFGFVGRLTEFKNLKFLLDVFKIYLLKYPNDKLFIYGAGSEVNYILNFIDKHKLSESIKYCGFESDKTKIYSELDVIVDPALGQGISNTNLEAMCTNTFIIASNVIGNKDIINHGKNGLLFNPLKHEDLLKQLEYYKENKGLVNEILVNALNEIRSKYDIDIIADKIYIALKSIKKFDN